LSVVLSDLGIAVSTAENGKVGLDTLFADDFDIVLMDIQMPVMDGYQAVAAMRERQWTKPVVALTANAMKGFEKKVLDAGFSHYQTKPIDLDKLTVLLAELLGGSYDASIAATQTPSQAKLTTSANGSTVNATGSEAGISSSTVANVSTLSPTESSTEPATADDAGPIISTLAAQNPKFAVIAAQFVEKLDEQLPLMQAQLDAQEFEALAKSAHWLKGSGGTVGYPQFKTPALELEIAAKAFDEATASNMLDRVRLVRARITNSDTALVSSAESDESKRSFTNAVPDTLPDNNSVDNPVVSTLPMDNPRFRGIVERFIARLDQQLDSIDECIQSENFSETAQLAHWLKGSGSNVGFTQFHELGASLESSAKEGNRSQAKIDQRAIRDFSRQIKAGWDDLPPLAKTA